MIRSKHSKREVVVIVWIRLDDQGIKGEEGTTKMHMHVFDSEMVSKIMFIKENYERAFLISSTV